MSTHPLLAVDEITAGYGAVTILRELSLTVPEGTITALVGANGAGKTTLMRVIAGLLAPSGGTIRFAGTDVTAAPTHRRVAGGLALVPEGRQVFPYLSVAENLRLGAWAAPARTEAAASTARVYELFPRLDERRAQAAGSLSGGEQQMLAVGRGLMAKPRLLLLDEPTLGLAPQMARMIFDTVQRLRDDGMTILIAEQDVRTTLAIADGAYVIENGRIKKQGAAAALRDDPEIRSAYLGL
ncbi:MAG: ABC transporter ATP-binding protein [Rhodospirillaceae bacterium]|nr:ABC transporter ATP-binding protein [Rhodospirillaceae bacterium]